MAQDYWKHLLTIRTSRSSGPGGQAVNKIESKVEARFHVDTAPWLSPYQKLRIHHLYGTKINGEGELIVTSQVHRSQKQNLEACHLQLEKIFAQAAMKPKQRVPTRATRGSKERRLKSKKVRSEIKAGRQKKYSI